MKQIANWNEVKAPAEYVELPAGGYICKIMGAEIETFKSQDGQVFEKLKVSIDIAEGDYAGYYAENYRNQVEEKKWKGFIRYYVPTEDGSDKDEWSKRTLKGFTDAVESSNVGYTWDWDETKLKGKRIGMLFRREEWEYNGKTGWKTAPFKAIDATNAATGEFKVPQDKPLKNHTVANPSSEYSANFVDVGSEEDLPF